MRTTYMICHQDRRHIALFTADELSEAALCIAARPNAAELLVYANDGGFSRELTESERRILDDHLASPWS